MKKFLTFILCAAIGFAIGFYFENGIPLITALVLWGIWAKDPGLKIEGVEFEFVPYESHSNIAPFTPPFFTSGR